MKSNYFTTESINDKSMEMLDKISEYTEKHKIELIAEQSALIILDMQRFFFEERSHANIPSAPPIIPKICNLAEFYNKMNLPVILTRHINTDKNAKLMSQWWRDIITEDDELSEIIPELDLPNSVVIKKTQYDGFYETKLEDILKELKVSQLIITGVMTHLCCETTVRSAFVRGYDVYFPINGTATYNEDFHLATFLNLSHGFAIPLPVEELTDHIEASKIV